MLGDGWESTRRYRQAVPKPSGSGTPFCDAKIPMKSVVACSVCRRGFWNTLKSEVGACTHDWIYNSGAGLIPIVIFILLVQVSICFQPENGPTIVAKYAG